jgi:hypothetical protein
MAAFHESVEECFGKVADDFDSKLERLSPRLYGFLTKYAVVTVGVYFGHIPNICVKLRERRPDDVLGVDDERDIGLGWLVAFAEPFVPIETPGARTEASLNMEVRRLAVTLSKYGRPFLADDDADWKRVQDAVAEKVRRESGPHEQRVAPGQPGDYTGVYGVHGVDAWITIEVVRRPLARGKVEKWSPVFEGGVPTRLQETVDSAANKECYVPISFRGVPSEKGPYGRMGSCIREVRILRVDHA